MDEVDFTVLAAKSVFSDMIDKCPPAETCRDAFDRTAKATIKMASSRGGFGTPAQHSRRQRRETLNWASAPDAATLRPPSRHRHHQSEQAPFQFDLSISDNLSSPSLSATGGMQTPPLGKSKTFEADTFMSNAGSHRGPSPSERTMSQDGGSSIDPSLVPSPPVSRRTAPQQSGSSANTFMGHQFGMQGSMDYPDAQTMEFLQNLGATPNGDVHGLDQAQLDLGFGINWEGMHNDFGEGQQMNPFDTFFFGGQQSGNGAAGGGGGGGNGNGNGTVNGNGDSNESRTNGRGMSM